ncbi:MAG: hypothetical protein K0S93_1038 [Nitrososphaeraceae archaeon]|jgi:hypothetical protein|nr:hypothetical protein [Nitrososphaeraceae archaeon]
MDNPEYNEGNKSFRNESSFYDNNISSNLDSIPRINKFPIEVAKVTICLTSNHKECNGKYIDSFTGKYCIKCLCYCHIQNSKEGDGDSVR